jgi:hypothetical protein
MTAHQRGGGNSCQVETYVASRWGSVDVCKLTATITSPSSIHIADGEFEKKKKKRERERENPSVGSEREGAKE